MWLFWAFSLTTSKIGLVWLKVVSGGVAENVSFLQTENFQNEDNSNQNFTSNNQDNADEKVLTRHTSKISQEIEAKIKGYEGEACGECGNFTLVRNGTCMKCNTCGATSGCS